MIGYEAEHLHRTANNESMLLEDPNYRTRMLTKARLLMKVHPTGPGVTGQSIHVPPAGLYPGLKRPRLDYTRVYYGLGQ